MRERVYAQPQASTWNKPRGGQFANFNRSATGPTHESELPVCRHLLQLHSFGTLTASGSAAASAR